MDLNKIFQKIQELSLERNKRDELRQFCSENIEQVLHGLPLKISNNDGGNILKCLLRVFSDTSASFDVIKVKIINITLKTMRRQATSLNHCDEVMSWLRLEIPKLAVQDLVKLSNESVQSIVDDSDVNMIWRVILPDVIKGILTHTTIKHCESEMTSEDYKGQCLRTLCQCQWKLRQIVPLVSMFGDMQLNQNDHKQLINKICSYISNIPPDSLPPLVHQLLSFCESRNMEIVLAHLSYYFTVRLYSKLEPPPQDSASTNTDIEDFVQYSPAELSNCLSTCMYHMSKGMEELDFVRKHVIAWPKTQLLRNPFIIDLALAVSDKRSEFKSASLDTVKSAIEQRILDEAQSKESAWLRFILPPDVDVASLLKVLTTESGNHRQLTTMGLINLAFNLLSVNASRPTAALCWSHGKLILVRLSKLQPETTPYILTKLSDLLSGEVVLPQFADCLYVLCKFTPVSVERCTQLATILEKCQPSPTDYRSAAVVLDAVRPLLNYSMRTRDVLVMVCRKGFYSNTSLYRCLALSGFLTVLRHIKLTSGMSSTSSQSWNSDENNSFQYLTQLTVDFHATEQGNTVRSRVRNEAVCCEVISIIQRCFLQDAAVKQLLYTKLYNCTKEKFVLHKSILEMMHSRLVKYISEDEENPLLLDKCVQETATAANLVEPISHMMYLVAQYLQLDDDDDLEDILSSQTRDTSNVHLKNQLNAIMNRLCATERLAVVAMEDPGLTDLTPESKAKNLKVQLLIQSYEALVAYKIMQWNPNTTGLADSVYRLYRNYYNIVEQTKTPAKSKKGNKSTANDTKEGRSQKSQKSQGESGKAPTKLNNMVKEKVGPFKPLPCLWDMKLCLRILQLLYSEEVVWSSTPEHNSLRARRDFHHWALRCVLSALNNDLEKKVVGTYVTSIAVVMYNRCICRFRDMCTFDDETALYCVDVFKACLNLIHSPNYSLKIESCLSKIVDQTDSTTAACIAKILVNVHNALAQIETDATEERDAVAKKLSASLNGLANMLLVIPVPSCLEMCNIIIKFEDFIRTSNLDCLSLIPSILAAGCREQQEAQFLDDLLRKLLITLGAIDEPEEDSNEAITDFPTIDCTTGHTVLIHICLHVNTRLEYVERLLNRARDLALAETFAVRAHRDRIAKEHKEVYKSIVIQLCQLCTWISACASMRCTVGAPSDKVFSVCMTFYKILCKLAKQIDVSTAQLVRFERLLKLCGKKLSNIIANFITYVEASQQQGKPNQVLRRTRLIPFLIFAAEQFNNKIIKMANKAKLNWQQYLSLGTARDFRIDMQALKEAYRTNDNEDAQGSDVDNEDAETVIIPSLPEREENEENSDGGESPRKSRRLV
ncbi:hypothetical protein K1T71_007072 [Dendrolimus kikuchii]|uniref:Uncharacterized protein n=1 Tax=Dendrolimus kikuchii TaxID=765133 RepID=A0ACC1CZK0_9NEOP|nr:hypothetical protein K1T71_007072 [Dendrolimus kikuchii]